MKRLREYDEYGQPIPRSKPLVSLETGRIYTRGVSYVTREEFERMQTELKEQLEKQQAILEEMLVSVKQALLHLASLSGESIESSDVED